MRRYLTLPLLLSMLSLAACGTRGSLYLPPAQKAPVPAVTAPAHSDLSTTNQTRS